MGKFKQTIIEVIKDYRGFWPGFTVGLGYFSWIFWWYWALYPLDALGIESNSIAFLLILLVFITSISITAVWWGLFGFLTIRLFKNFVPPFILAPAIASIFTIAEYLRAVFFSVFWFGSGGSIGPHWPIGNLAYLFVNFELLATTASIWGIYGITFILALLTTTLVLIVRKKNIRISVFEMFISIIIVASVGSLIDQSDKGRGDIEPMNLAIVQTNTPSRIFDDTERSLQDTQTKLQLLKSAAGNIKEGVIVFPEGTNILMSLSQFLNPSGIQKYFNDLSEKNIMIVDSIRISDEEKFKSRAVIIDSKNGALGFYDKQILTPGGEFLPYIIKLPLSIISPRLKDQFKTYREYSRGSGSNIISYGNSSFKMIICSELISPLKVSKGNADFNIIIGSFAIWQGNPRAVGQALVMSRFRAIENGKYTVLASNSGRSYIINPMGKIEKISSPDSYELLTGSIVPNMNRTWYNYVGDWPILLLSSVFLGLSLKKIRDGTKS